MNMVGHDKRLNYYQMGTEAVIAELKSHKMGLTNPEATRRLEQNGPNVLSLAPIQSWHYVWLRQLKNPLVITPVIIAAAYLYLQETGSALLFGIVATLNAFIDSYIERRHSWRHAIECQLPTKVSVVRNGDTKSIPVGELAIGDIVKLESNDHAPADLRILTAKHAFVDASALTGASEPYIASTMPLTSELPIAQRTNMVYAGSVIQQGSLQAMVVATGTHTELGQAIALTEALPNEASLVARYLHRVSLCIFQVIAVTAVLIAAIIWQQQFNQITILSAATAVLAAAIPFGLPIVLATILAHIQSKLYRKDVIARRLASLLSLGGVRQLILNLDSFLTTGDRSVQSLLIGRSTYSVHEPDDAPWHLRDKNHKQVSTTALHELSLFFMAAALTSSNHQESAAVASFTSKAKVDVERLQQAHKPLGEITLPSMHGALHAYGKDRALFVAGNAVEMLSHVSRVWDHGHERRFTAADQSFYREHIDNEMRHGLQVQALAYRIIPERPKGKELQHVDYAGDLALLGLISITNPLYKHAAEALETAKSNHLAVAWLADTEPELSAGLLRSVQDELPIITSEDFTNLSDTQLIEALQQGALFSQLSFEHKRHLVSLARSQGALAGDAISMLDLPVVGAATVSLSSARACPAVQAQADLLIPSGGIVSLVHALQQTHTLPPLIRTILRAILTNSTSQIAAILFSITALVAFHIPLVFDAMQLLALVIIGQVPVLASLGWDKQNTNHTVAAHVVDWVTMQRIAFFGIISGAITYGVYLLFFAGQNLSPAYLDSTSNLHMQAMSIALLTLYLCQILNAMFARAESHRQIFTAYLLHNRLFIATVVLTLFGILNVVYNPLVQPFFGTQPIALGDWFWIILGFIAYGCIRMMQRHLRKHSRHAVIKLHRKVYGKSAPAKV